MIAKSGQGRHVMHTAGCQVSNSAIEGPLPLCILNRSPQCLVNQSRVEDGRFITQIFRHGRYDD
jgi:hypothetical protein